MKVIKELIQYLFQSDKLSRKELDWFLKNDHLDYSEWKEIGLLKQKRHSEKHQFNPLKTEESIPDSKGRRGGEKFQSNLASLIYDLNKEVLGKQDHWEKDLKPLLRFAGGLLRKNFTDSKTAIEGLLNFIQSQSVEANEKSFSSLFQSEAELKEDLEFLLNYPKPKKCLEDRKYRHLKEKMLSEKGLKLPSRFIPIERRPGFLWLKDFLFLQTVLKPVSAAFQNEENVKAVFGTKNFLFHFQENGELDFLEAADTVIFFGFIMKKKDRIYYEEKLQELRILIAPSEIYSGKTNPIEVRIKRIENGQRLKTELPQEMEIHRIHFKKDSEVFFYPNGNLYEVNLSGDTLIHGILVTGYIGFYQNQNVKIGTLADKTKIKELVLYKSDQIEFYENGNIKMIVFKGIRFLKEVEFNSLIFDEGGILIGGFRSRSFLEKDFHPLIQEKRIIRINGLEVFSDCIDFHDCTIFKRVVLAQDAFINGILFKKDNIVDFYENGNVKNGTLAQDAFINGILFSNCTVFHKNGNVREGILAQDTTINGILFRKKNTIELYESGNVVFVIPAQDISINGIPFSKGYYIHFHKNGKVRKGILAQDASINGILFSKGYYIHFYESGKVRKGILAQDASINGILFRKESQFVFYESGNVVFVIPAQDTTINGILFRKKNTIELYESGKVSRGKLAQGTTINGILFRKKNAIELYESGKVRRGKLAQDISINGILFSKGYYIHFYESGNVREGIVAQDTTIQGILFRKDDTIKFNENGIVMRGILAQDISINGILFSKDQYIEFHDNGSVEKAMLAQDISINGILFSKGYYIHFYESGKVSIGVLAEDTSINGRMFSKGDTIKFSEDGNVL